MLVWLDEILLMICREEETVPRARMRNSMKAVQMLEYLKQLSTVRWVYNTVQCTVTAHVHRH